MGITINAEDVSDALSKLRRDEPSYAIKIRWRRGDDYDYRSPMLMDTGCIVNAVGMPGQDVERSFKTAGEALRHLSYLLKMVDARAREQKKNHDKHLREQAKKSKAGA